MIKAIIIEDETHCRNTLISLLKLVADDVDVIGEASNMADGIQLVNDNQFDVLFLDIDLPDGTGFNILENVTKHNFNIVFTTAHNDHAIKAFKHSAIDYLLKPLDPDELAEAIKKVRKNGKLNNIEHKVELLYENFNQKKFERISLPTFDGFEVVSTQDIVLFSAENNYTNVHLKQGKKILVTKTIKLYDDLLASSGFLRVHQSHLVNVSSIVKYTNGDGGSLTLANNSTIEVSRRKKESLLKFLKNTN